MAILVMLLFGFLTFPKGIRATLRPGLVYATPCPRGYSQCNGTEVCLERSHNCDGKVDCPDGSDEWKSTCLDEKRAEFYNKLFRKRPDMDREKNLTECDFEAEDVPGACTCAGVGIFCENRGLRAFPSPLPSGLRDIDLSGNFFPRLETDDIPLLPRLNRTILMKSHLEHLGPDTFKNLPNLQNLYLTGNKISILHGRIFISSSKLKLLILSYNPLEDLDPDAFEGLQSLIELDLRDCRLTRIHPGTFHHLPSIQKLLLDGNRLTNLSPQTFSQLPSLTYLSLSRNTLHTLPLPLFRGLKSLDILSLAYNRLDVLVPGQFADLSALQKLDLEYNLLDDLRNGTFSNMVALRSLNLRGNALTLIENGVFEELLALEHVYFQEFRLCSRALQARVCLPHSDGISSAKDLLASLVLRVSVWAMAAVACAGNLGVLVGRAVLREPNPRHACYIQNLALADLLMGLYLMLIAAHDVAFRGSYLIHAAVWRSSWRCGLAGFLCTLSSEASVLILSIITLDRYASVIHPLSVQRRTRAAAGTHMALAWSLAAALAGAPLITAGRQFYGHNGVCLPLHVHDPWGPGWQWSVAEFCGLNLAALVLVAGAYGRMFLRISGSKSGLRSTQQLQDRAVAQRFALIVATDFLCWLPIIVVKFVAMAGVHVDEDLYAWVAVFLLPVNSALNPILYTLTTKLFKQRLARLVFSCRSDPAVISFSTLLRGHRLSDNENSSCSKASLVNGRRCPVTHQSSLKSQQSTCLTNTL